MIRNTLTDEDEFYSAGAHGLVSPVVSTFLVVLLAFNTRVGFMVALLILWRR
jgi:hypothetical protein